MAAKLGLRQYSSEVAGSLMKLMYEDSGGCTAGGSQAVVQAVLPMLLLVGSKYSSCHGRGALRHPSQLRLPRLS